MNDLWIANLRGSQEEMGHQHGELLRSAGGWQEMLDFYTHMPERLLLGDLKGIVGPVVRYLVAPAKDLLLRRLERDRPQIYADRSRAFMEGLGVSSSYVRYFGVCDLFQNAVGLAARYGVGPFQRRAHRAAVPACSSLVVWGDSSAGGATRHARNFDFPGIGIWDASPAVVFCDPDEGQRYGFVTARGADLPGVTAFNEAGLVISAHTRFHRDVAFSGASIIDIGHDIVRRAESIDDAVAVARERSSASSWGLCVSSAQEHRAVVIEMNSTAVEVVESGARDEHLTCANRYRHPDTMRGEVAMTEAWAVHSDMRELRLGQLVTEGRDRDGMTAIDLQRALDDHTDPDAPGDPRGAGAIVSQPCTVKSVVADAGDQSMYVSIGSAPTARGPYARIDWDWDRPVGAREHDRTGAGTASTDAERAYDRFVQAARIDTATHDADAVLRELEAAVVLAPDDPSYRFLAGVLQLRADRGRRALAHLDVALERETSSYRRAHVLLWAARAAAAVSLSVRAATLRSELYAMTDARIARQQASARKDERKPLTSKQRKRISVQLLMADATVAR
jgi:hypothetical protein